MIGKEFTVTDCVGINVVVMLAWDLYMQVYIRLRIYYRLIVIEDQPRNIREVGELRILFGTDSFHCFMIC